MNHFENNLAVISQHQPEFAQKLRMTKVGQDYEKLTSKTGKPVVKVRGITLHSAYDPEKEAERAVADTGFAPGTTVILQGFGLGYTAELLVKKDLKIIIAEADIAVIRIALEMRGLTAVLSNILFFDSEDPAVFNSFLTGNGIPAESPVIKHSPSVKLNPLYYAGLSGGGVYSTAVPPPLPPLNDNLVSFAPSRSDEADKSLKILIPSPLYGGSLPIAGYCRKAFESLGHSVEYADCTPYYPVFKAIADVTPNEDHQAKLRALYTMFVAQVVLAKALEFKPDLVFGVAQSPFTQESLADFKRMNIPVAFWFMEDYNVLTYWKTFAPLYDHFFVIQRGTFSTILDQMGVNHHYLPLAAEPDVHKPLQLSPSEQTEYGSDLSFVGAGYPNRRQFFSSLLEEDFKLWGTEWDLNSPLARVLQRNGGRISTEDCVKIFNASKININLHSWMDFNGINPNGDFVNPRTFEIAAAGGFQLTDPRSELNQLFDIGTELITFSDFADFQRKKEHYLSHPDETASIAENARRRVLAEHTYRHRMQEVLRVVLGIEPAQDSAEPAATIPFASNPDQNPNIAGNLVKSAGDDQELREIFAAFDPQEVLDVDKIAEYIYTRDRDLNQAEGVFLLMKEFADWARQKKVI